MTGPSKPGLILAPQHVVQIIDHAREERPAEACGLLGGQSGRVESVHPLPNAEQSGVRYLAEPQAQLDAMLEIEDKGQEIVGIYHSHIGAPAHPSRRDVEMATYPSAIYLIVSLTGGKPPVLGAFRIRDGEVTEVDISIESPVQIGE